MRDPTHPIAEQISVDEEREIVTIFGQQFSAELLENFAKETPPGQWFRIQSNDEGVLVLHWRREPST